MEDAARLETAEKLTGLQRADWKYADLYARAAEAALAPVCTRAHFEALRGQRSQLPHLISELERAIRRGDWKAAEKLAEEGRDLRAQIERERHLFSLAEAIYGPRFLDPQPTALSLAGVVAQPARILEAEIVRLVRDLRTLAVARPEERGLYERRAAELERMIVDLPDDPPPRIDPAEQRVAALDAATGGDFGAVLRVARTAARSGQDRSGRIRAPRPSSSWVASLSEPFPADAAERAARLGFAVAVLEPNEAANDYSSCRCADRASLPARPLSAEQRTSAAGTCGHACPPEVRSSLRTSLDALMAHPFLTSGGTRYLPWFGAETILVEVFPEDEPDARTALLESLLLPRRQGLTRFALEDALLANGPGLCEDLGLDPVSYRITCIPFDVYQRLARRYRWGARERWTHFDGYQLTRELELQALVGGDVRYGGVDDLCGVGRSYDSDHITARFAILRRGRFEVRAAHEPVAAE